MTKAFKMLVLLATVGLMSFTGKDDNSFIGTYGVSDSDPSQIKLTIHADHTFTYQDFSVADHKIEASGKWTLKGNKVVLTDNNPDKAFHDTWTFDQDGQVAKSRKGLCFYRLCRVGS